MQVSQKTKDKLKARILQGTKQGALFEFLKFGAQQNLQKSLQNQLTKQSLLVRASKQHDDFPLSASVANEVLSFAEQNVFTKKEDAAQLQQVHDKATRCGHTELAQVTHDVLTQIKPG